MYESASVSPGVPAEEERPPAAQVSSAWHALAAEEVLRRLESDGRGLAQEEAAARRARDGPNRLLVIEAVPAWKILGDQLRSVLVALLAAATLLSALTGDLLEAGAIAAVLVLDVAIGFTVEWRARRAVEGLRQLDLTRATVRRDGRESRVEAGELVVGDVVVLEAGDTVPADARLLRASELRAVEAPLTGEPFPVEKQTAPANEDAPLAERTSMVYKGTLVVDGRALAVVTAIGAGTEVGRIGELVRATSEGPTPLERRLDRLGSQLGVVALAAAALVAVAGVLRGVAPWLMLRSAVALAVAAVPEGLPAVATIVLAIGLRRMAQRHALVRRLPAVETLGAVTVLCTDKTGTLTAGEMVVTTLHVCGEDVEVTGSGHAIDGAFLVRGAARSPLEMPGLSPTLAAGALANRAHVDEIDGTLRGLGDPTEVALLVAARKAGLDLNELAAALPEEAEIPFRSERRWMATVHRHPDGFRRAFVKGAPASVLARCSRAQGAGGAEPLDGPARAALLAANERLARGGLRVLAIAEGDLEIPGPVGEDDLRDLVWLGLVGIDDPPAEGVREVVAELQGAGIRTVMLTGDQVATAEAFARNLGLISDRDGVMSGHELAATDRSELLRRVRRVGAFGRVEPAHKLEVISALQEQGEIVAMVGDGVNDAPALKRADIGVAMGLRGTDLAKETADLVLADDRLQSVAAAVAEGRVILDNIVKVISYLFACNLAEIGVVWVAVLAGLPLPLSPLQILWLNLVTDVFPALALAMEPAEPDVMRRGPRDPRRPLLSRVELIRVVGFGLAMTVTSLLVFVWALSRLGMPAAGTAAFLTLAATQLFHALDARSTRPVVLGRRFLENGWVWLALTVSFALQLVVIYVPGLARVFGTVPLSPRVAAAVLAAAAVPLVLGQTAKAWRHRPRGGDR